MESIRRRLEEALATPHQESAQAVLSTDLPLSESSKLVNKNTVKEADLLGHMGIGTDHMLLGVLATETEPPCLAKSILNELGCYLENTRVIVLAIGPYQ